MSTLPDVLQHLPGQLLMIAIMIAIVFLGFYQFVLLRRWGFWLLVIVILALAIIVRAFRLVLV
jgi:hypothetical protein